MSARPAAMRAAIRLSAFSTLLLCLSAQSHAAEFLNPPGDAALNLPFSDAVRVGNMLILSGKLGTLPGTTELVP